MSNFLLVVSYLCSAYVIDLTEYPTRFVVSSGFFKSCTHPFWTLQTSLSVVTQPVEFARTRVRSIIKTSFGMSKKLVWLALCAPKVGGCPLQIFQLISAALRAKFRTKRHYMSHKPMNGLRSNTFVADQSPWISFVVSEAISKRLEHMTWTRKSIVSGENSLSLTSGQCMHHSRLSRRSDHGPWVLLETWSRPQYHASTPKQISIYLL